MSTYQMPDFDFDLTINEEQLNMRGKGGSTALDEHMQMLRNYPSRLRVSSLKLNSHDSDEAEKKITEVSFNLIANPHAKCDFDYICVYLNLEAWPGARIADMSPQEIKGDEPVKYTTKYDGGIKFSISKTTIGPNLSAETSTESNVYFVKLRGTGIDDSLAYWIFEKEPHGRLYFNNLLTLLVEHRAVEDLAEPVFTIEANLRLSDWKGFIPIYGQKKITL